MAICNVIVVYEYEWPFRQNENSRVLQEVKILSQNHEGFVILRKRIASTRLLTSDISVTQITPFRPIQLIHNHAYQLHPY